MNATSYDLYHGLSDKIRETIPSKFILGNGDFDWMGQVFYLVDIKNLQIGFNGFGYVACDCVLYEQELNWGSMGEKIKLDTLPFGFVVDKGSQLHVDIENALTTTRDPERVKGELKGICEKVFKDVLTELSGDESAAPRFGHVSYELPKTEEKVVEEFTPLVKEALGTFYYGLVENLDGVEGSFEVLVKDVKLEYVQDSKQYFINLSLHLKDTNKGQDRTLLFRLPVNYDYYVEEHTGKLAEVSRVMIAKFTDAQTKPFVFGDLKLILTKYNGLPKSLRWLVSKDKDATENIHRRLKIAFNNENVKGNISDMKMLNGGIIKVKVSAIQGAKTSEHLYFGVNGISSGIASAKIYHKGENSLMDALKRLNNLYGQSDMWFVILNCYDKRKKVE